MREQLIQYVELLFAGAPNSGEIKQEILQNTLDRYDDLVSQGKQPEAAYRLAISGIGDVNEILGSIGYPVSAPKYAAPAQPVKQEYADTAWKKLLRACAIGLYIISAIPLFVLSEMGMSTIGLCGTLSLVAVATVLIILGKKKTQQSGSHEQAVPAQTNPKQELRRSIRGIVWAIGLAIYFIVSYTSGAWYITWVIFPIIGSVQGLIIACMDLKEANHYEE